MKLLSNPTFLMVYSGVLTLTFAGVVLWGAANLQRREAGILNARRINIVEPDGTVRMTISNRADFPGEWRNKKEYPRPDRKDAAGLLFMSEEGGEQGGLIWGASQLPDGSIQNHLHLSFDQYEENQVLALDAGQEGPEKFSRLTIVDQGDFPIEEKRKAEKEIEALPEGERNAAWKRFFETHRHDVKRLVLGRSEDGSVGLNLRDGKGKVRIVLNVRPDGTPALQFLDATGKVVREFSETSR